MAVLLVTYDLNKPGEDYSGFHDVIKGYTCVKLSESSYAIDTHESPSSIHEKLYSHMDKNDHVYIITLANPWQGYGPKDVDDWLNGHL